VHHISARAQTGLEPLLDDNEQQILTATGRRKLKMRVPSGGPEMAWLYKNAAVVETTADEENPERLLKRLKDQQREKHPGFDGYIDCMTRSLFTGLATFCLSAFSSLGFFLIIA